MRKQIRLHQYKADGLFYAEWRFGKTYKPHKCITIDKELFPLRCHIKFAQYIQSKPAKYGIKVF